MPPTATLGGNPLAGTAPRFGAGAGSATAAASPAEQAANLAAETGAAEVSMENPSPQTPGDVWMQLEIAQADIDMLVSIASDYRNQWAMDRLYRQRIWIKNALMYRGIQVLDWHEGTKTWVDTLAWYRESDKAQEGSTAGLERYTHPLTLMLGLAFVGLMSQEMPATIVRPQDARVLADVTTATAAETALEIIERWNNVRQMTRGEFEMIYLYGTYFKWTRGVLDGSMGYDEEPMLAEVTVAQPDRMRCPECSRETPIAELKADVNAAAQMECPACRAVMGPENFYEAGPGYQAMQAAGVRRIPRAIVKQTIHTPLEVDVDPEAATLEATAILAFDTEVDIGEVRMMFPNALESLQEGAEATTTTIADYERLRRSEIYSMGTAYTTDTDYQRPTLSRLWLQPMAYWRKGDKEFAERMMAAAPDGLMLTMVGAAVVAGRPAKLTREWTMGRRLNNWGPYCPSVAEFVTNFNERFNGAMQLIDDYYMRAACGVNLVAGWAIDTDAWKGNTLAPSTVLPVPTSIKGQTMPLGQIFQHFDIPVNPGLPLYPQMLLTFAQLLNGLTPQIMGQGTQDGVDTFGGQQQMLSLARLSVEPCWENVKDEHAQAAQNAIECLQRLLKCGAAREIWQVVEDQGQQFRNDYVDLERMQGRVRVYADEDQGLPQTADQVRKAFTTIFTELTSGNPAAQAIFDVPANQETIGSVLFPGLVSPVAAQRAKTLEDLNTLLTQTATPFEKPDGSIGMQLPVMPSPFENYETALDTLQEFAIENCDLRVKNPVGWSQVEQYWGALQQGQAAEAARKAKLGMMVQASAAPPSQGPPAEVQAAVAKLDAMASQLVEMLPRLATMDPALTKGTITGQVNAVKEGIEAALKAQKALAEK